MTSFGGTDDDYGQHQMFYVDDVTGTIRCQLNNYCYALEIAGRLKYVVTLTTNYFNNDVIYVGTLKRIILLITSSVFTLKTNYFTNDNIYVVKLKTYYFSNDVICVHTKT